MSLPSLETSSKAIHFSVFSQYMSRENAHLHLLRSLHVDAHSNSVTKQREVNEFFRGVATRCCWRHVLIRTFSIYTKIIPAHFLLYMYIYIKTHLWPRPTSPEGCMDSVQSETIL